MPPQTLRPNSVVSAGSFVQNSGATVYGALGDDSDGTHTRSNRSGADAVKVNLPAATGPVATTGRQAILYLTYGIARTAYVSKASISVLTGPPAPTVVQDASAGATTTSLPVTMSGTPATTSNVMVAAVSRYLSGGVGAGSVVDDRGGSSYTMVSSQAGGGDSHVSLWWGRINSISGAPTLTFHVPAAEAITMDVMEVNGVDADDLVDIVGRASGAAAGSCTVNLSSTTDTNRLIIGALTYREAP